MAPNPLDTVDDEIKNTINSLYAIQSSTHGYLGSETQAILGQEVRSLSQSLAKLQDLARPSGGNQRPDYNPNDPAYSALPALLPPELIQYVDDGRNPDIYTREFVEITQKGNAYVKGKSDSLTSFRDILAEKMVAEWPEMKDDVDMILKGKGHDAGQANGEVKRE